LKEKDNNSNIILKYKLHYFLLSFYQIINAVAVSYEDLQIETKSELTLLYNSYTYIYKYIFLQFNYFTFYNFPILNGITFSNLY